VGEASKHLPIEKVYILSRSAASSKHVDAAVAMINERLGIHLEVEFVVGADDAKSSIDIACKCNTIDCAIICVPDALHYEYGKSILSRHIHCMIVKPFATKLADAENLYRLQKKNKVWGAVEFHKRFDEANKYVKKIYLQGQLGDPVYITVDYSQKIIIPTVIFRKWVHETNIFQYLAVHYVDLIHYITGYLPTDVTAIGTKSVLVAQGINTYDSVHAIIKWMNPHDPKKEFVSVINTNWIDPMKTSAMSDQRYTIVGTKGRLDIDQKDRGIQVVNDDEGLRAINPYFSEYLVDIDGVKHFGGYGYHSVFTFLSDVNNLNNGRVNLAHLEHHRPGFRSCLPSVAVTEAVNKCLAAGSGKWLKIPKSVI
jgi:predicted dehydrogenase